MCSRSTAVHVCDVLVVEWLVPQALSLLYPERDAMSHTMTPSTLPHDTSDMTSHDTYQKEGVTILIYTMLVPYLETRLPK
jgi:hypothetical protein